ncbi:MAG: magnesium/cobalt transporter CorA [bacterium]
MNLFGRRRSKVGLPPGTPVYLGPERTDPCRITVIDYNNEKLEERHLAAVEDAFSYRDTPTLTWLNVDGVHDVERIEKLAASFNIHPLVIEDIVHTSQRPKVEDFGDYAYLVVRMLSRDDAGRLVSEQVSFVLSAHWVISFQEQAGDVFEPIRARLRTGKGRIRGAGADYLLYSLLDAVVDNYFVVFELYGEQVEEIEQRLAADPSRELLSDIHALKRELTAVRRSVWPLREAVSALLRAESALVSPLTVTYLRDVYDHTVQVIETVESHRETVSGLLDLYLSSISNRMNEVMKVLTIIATIFIPLTFIAGIYGMNFGFMPELRWRWGYFIVLGVMAAVALGMVHYFHRRRWL